MMGSGCPSWRESGEWVVGAGWEGGGETALGQGVVCPFVDLLFSLYYRQGAVNSLLPSGAPNT